MSMNDWRNEFENKNVLIWGFGLEGKASYRLIRKVCPDLVVTIADSRKGTALERAKADTVNTICIYDDEADFSSYDLILKSPGIVLPEGMDTSNISGESQLFLKHYADRTIGITGTKGKSTTTSVTAAVLREKYPVVLVGNIGIPCFDAVEEMEAGALAAFEISCHQLEYCPYSPHVGVYLNLYEEHLDHYGSFKAYGDAKSKVIANQKDGDIAILHEDLTQYFDLAKSEPVLIGRDITAEGNVLHIPGKSMKAENCKLIGEHNYRNLATAWYIASLFGVTDEQVLHAAESFDPLHHRLEDLGEAGDIRYVNDSISTIGQSCIQALEALENVDTVLVGGMDRGIEYRELEEYLSNRTDVKVIFMYTTGKRIYQEMEQNSQLREGLYVTEDLYEAVALAKKLTRPHHTCLLSPAASSYDHFKNFEHRGDEFRKAALGE